MSESEPSSPSWPTSAAPGCHLSTVHRRWPHSSGRRCRHGRHDTPHSPSARPFSPSLSRARLRRRKRHRHCRRELRELRPRASHLASERLQVCLELLHLLHPLVGRDLPEVSCISRVAVVGFTAVATPTPTNLAATPFLPSFFLSSRVRVCLGLGCGPCHAIPALVPPS